MYVHVNHARQRAMQQQQQQQCGYLYQNYQFILEKKIDIQQ